jgi:hypothetical protein
MFDEDSRFSAGRKLALQNLPLRAMEVHSDRKARLTGQFFLEYSCRGRDSGISISTAKYWAIELNDDCWAVVPTTRLRQLVEERRLIGAVVNGGDGGAAEGVLIPLAALFTEPRKSAARDDGQMTLEREKVG